MKLLTRHGYLYTQGRHWTQRHIRWLRSLEFDQPFLRDVFDSYFTEMHHCMQRLDSLDKDVQKLANSDTYHEVVGLTSSEDSSGQSVYKGPITKAGNKRIRRLLVETSRHYRHRYLPTSNVLRQRRKDQPQWAIDIADKAGQRLHKRYCYLVNHGKPQCVATVAVARELAGFIWSVFNEYHVRNQHKAA